MLPAAPTALAYGDIDGDDDMDIIASTETGIFWLENDDGLAEVQSSRLFSKTDCLLAGYAAADWRS